MSLFLCPNASRSLLRALVQGGSQAAPRWAATSTSTSPSAWATTRWLSCSAPGRTRVAGACIASRTGAPGYLHQQRRTFFGPNIIRNYEELPKDYRDSVGLEFGKPISEAEAVRLFGPGITGKSANHLLRILHGRRVAGTLDDPAFAVHTLVYTDDQQAKALEYLRRKAPVEELLNAGLRAEDELALLEKEMEQSAQKKAKKNQKPAETETEAEPAPEPEFEAVEVKPDPIYGRGKLDQIRERNIARRKAQEKLDEEERLAREAAGEVQSGPLAKVGEQQERQIANPRIAEYYAKATSDMQEPPQLSSLQRILPSATVVALVIGLLAAISTVYEEPADRYRLIPELTPAQATVGVIIGINAMVMLAWRVPPLWALLNRTMIFVVATPRPLTLFTAMFSHPRPSHLLVNMTVLWFIGTALHDELGRARFLTLFLGCGATGFLGSLVTYTLRGWLTTTTLGASGATLGLLAAYFWEHRDDGFRFGGLPENGVHGIVFLALIVALQLATLGKTVRLKIDVASHIAGLAAGLAGIQLLGRSRMGRAGAEGEARPKTVFNVIEAPGRDLPT